MFGNIQMILMIKTSISFNHISLLKKIKMLQFLLAHYLLILMISESKLDVTFPSWQFQIYAFRTPYRQDWNERGWEVLLFIRENLITRLLYSFSHDIEILLLELNARKKNWFIFCCYNPHKNIINYHLKE